MLGGDQNFTQTDRERERQTERDRQRQTDTQTDRQTDTHRGLFYKSCFSAKMQKQDKEREKTGRMANLPKVRYGTKPP